MVITFSERTLVARVQVDIGVLQAARSAKEHPAARQRAQQAVVDAFIEALRPEDRERLETYVREH